jgi:beta-glucosidase-like glycosyl hydrolase
MMVSYNEIDGEPNAQSTYLLTDIPRGQVGGNGPRGKAWDGFISSDFGAIDKLQTGHKVVPTSAAAIAAYITAGGSVQGESDIIFSIAKCAQWENATIL